MGLKRGDAFCRWSPTSFDPPVVVVDAAGAYQGLGIFDLVHLHLETAGGLIRPVRLHRHGAVATADCPWRRSCETTPRSRLIAPP